VHAYAHAEIGNAYAHAEICMSCCPASALGSRSSDPLSSGWVPPCMRERQAQAFMLKQASSSVHGSAQSSSVSDLQEALALGSALHELTASVPSASASENLYAHTQVTPSMSPSRTPRCRPLCRLDIALDIVIYIAALSLHRRPSP
jgi:hypothetical protein